MDDKVVLMDEILFVFFVMFEVLVLICVDNAEVSGIVKLFI